MAWRPKAIKYIYSITFFLKPESGPDTMNLIRRFAAHLLHVLTLDLLSTSVASLNPSEDEILTGARGD